MITAIKLVAGILVMLAGRRLYWVFVSGLGFLTAFALMARLMADQTEWVVALLALIAGAIGAMLAVFLQRLVIGITGFLAGGYALAYLSEILASRASLPEWLPFLIGGILGAMLITTLFDWGLILLSALIGATLVVQALQIDPWLKAPLFVGLTLLSVLFQAPGLSRPAASPVLREENEEEE